MGNRTSRGFDYGTFVRLIEEGPNYLSADQSVWSSSEKRCLKEFLILLKDPRLPWAGSVQEAFTRVRLAVPKSKMAAEIHAYVEDPIQKDLEAFGLLHPKAQICWAHFYSLVMFMWVLHQGRPCSIIFHESDLLYYVFRNEEGTSDYEKIDLFLHAVEKIHVIIPSQGRQTLTKDRLLLGPFILIEGSITSGSVRIEAEEGPRLIDPGVYSTDGPVTISGATEAGLRSREVDRIKKVIQKVRDTEPIPEKCGQCIEQRLNRGGLRSRHFLNRWPEKEPEKEESETEEEQSAPPSPQREESPRPHDQCGPADTREYFDEILFRLDALCRFHKHLGFK